MNTSFPNVTLYIISEKTDILLLLVSWWNEAEELKDTGVCGTQGCQSRNWSTNRCFILSCASMKVLGLATYKMRWQVTSCSLSHELKQTATCSTASVNERIYHQHGLCTQGKGREVVGSYSQIQAQWNSKSSGINSCPPSVCETGAKRTVHIWRQFSQQIV